MLRTAVPVGGEKKGWGFNTQDIDTKVRPQDDFFRYASGNWMKHHPIPKAEARWGSFTMLRHETDKQLLSLLKKLGRKRKFKSGTPEQMIHDFYRSGVALFARRAKGLSPLHALIKEIGGIKSPTTIAPVIARMERVG